jgi:hypothetical protein
MVSPIPFGFGFGFGCLAVWFLDNQMEYSRSNE